MNTPIMKVVGKDGQVELYEDKVVIIRSSLLGLLEHGLKGNKEIPLSQITAAQLKECSKLSGGYLHLSVLGGAENKGGFFSTDENTVVFGTADPRAIFSSKVESINSEWRKIKNEIIARAEAFRKKSAGTFAPSKLDELEKLGNLYQRGIITEQEFLLKKKELLKD